MLFALALVAIMAIAGIVSLRVLPTDRRAGWYLIGMGAFNGVLAFVNNTPEASTLTRSVVLVALVLCTLGSVGLMLDACSIAYEGHHPFNGFIVATSVALTVGDIIRTTHYANPVTLGVVGLEAIAALVLGFHLLRGGNSPGKSRIPEAYRHRADYGRDR